MNGESSMETYTLTCVKQKANGNLLHDSGNPNQGSIREAGMGGRWEGGSREMGHMHTYD